MIIESRKEIEKIEWDYCAFLRSGVIPYTVLNGNLHFLLGWDAHSRGEDLSDFGGGVKKGENAFIGGTRECDEELHGCLTTREYNHIKYAIFDGTRKVKICILFCRVDEKLYKTIRENFHKNCRQTSPEMLDVQWIHEKNMIEYVKPDNYNSPIWNRIRHTLSSDNSFDKEFLKMLKEDTIY